MENYPVKLNIILCVDFWKYIPSLYFDRARRRHWLRADTFVVHLYSWVITQAASAAYALISEGTKASLRETRYNTGVVLHAA